jgi:hypothetical protein
MCPDCREARLPAVRALNEALADVVAPDRQIPPGKDDYALELAGDLQQVLGRAGYVVLLYEDAAHLINSAHYGVPPRAEVLVRAAEALSEAPKLRLIGANAIPPRPKGSDHGGKTTPLTNPPP